MVSPPVFELNLCQDVSDIPSHLSYNDNDDDDDATTIYSMQDKLDDYDDDRFRQLFCNTQHWYVDGLDALHPQWHMIPTIIYEDSYYYHPYHQHYYDNEMTVVEDHPAMDDYGVDQVDLAWQAPPPPQQQSRQEQQQQLPVVILGQPRSWQPPEYGYTEKECSLSYSLPPLSHHQMGTN